MLIPMRTDLHLSRRQWLTLASAAALTPAVLRPAHAIGRDAAVGLVQQVTAEITRIINSGQSEGAMINDFERMIGRYADMPTIAQSVLGPPARAATAGQLQSFSSALQGYMARKYGGRFREFIGGTVSVTGTQETDRFVEVISNANLRGQAPFEVRFRVWDRSGSPRFIDMVIEGISLVITERNEVGALLDRRGGDINALIGDLQNLG